MVAEKVHMTTSLNLSLPKVGLSIPDHGFGRAKGLGLDSIESPVLKRAGLNTEKYPARTDWWPICHLAQERKPLSHRPDRDSCYTPFHLSLIHI